MSQITKAVQRLSEIWPLFVAGAFGGLVAYLSGLPMPFMLGGIAGAGTAVFAIESRRGTTDLRLPKRPREVFVALIGTMIGSSFSPELLAVLPAFWISVLAVLAFIVTAQLGGYLIMSRIGGYGKMDALFASMPGGLIEASILGEKMGADPKLVSVQHFIRIILVVFSVPFLFWIVTGAVVGSASGQGFGAAVYDAWDVIELILIVPFGMVLGKVLRLPASHMMGPVILSAVLHITGIVDIASPPWLLHLAQFVVGIALGAQFSGLSGAMILRGLWVGVAVVTFMLGISLGFALGLAPLLPADIAVMFLAFAPGGVTEMSLIALSLHISPVLVTVHHLIRIIFAVFVTQAIARRLA